jgi:tRNA A22 N-methylase
MAQLSVEELKSKLAVVSLKAQEQGHVLGHWHYGHVQVTIPGMGGSSLQTVLTAGCEKCRADVSITLTPNHTLGEAYGLALTYPCPNT